MAAVPHPAAHPSVATRHPSVGTRHPAAGAADRPRVRAPPARRRGRGSGRRRAAGPMLGSYRIRLLVSAVLTGSQRSRPLTRPLGSARVGLGTVRPRAAPRRRSYPGRPSVPPPSGMREHGRLARGRGMSAGGAIDDGVLVPLRQSAGALVPCRSPSALRIASGTWTPRLLNPGSGINHVIGGIKSEIRP